MVTCWGFNNEGQLGIGSTGGSYTTPQTVSGITGSSLAAGHAHTCAIISATDIAKCWGDNAVGQLGNGSTSDSNVPVDVTLAAGERVFEIDAGYIHTCARMSTGEMRCWGSNGYGQLGTGTLGSSTTPVDVIGLSGGVSALDSGNSYSCVVTSAGGAKCWGFDGSGQVSGIYPGYPRQTVSCP